MKAWTVIGYAYEADLHCVACATARFGDPDKEGLEDSEGNTVHPIFEGDEGTEDGEVCGDCMITIREGTEDEDDGPSEDEDEPSPSERG